MKSLFVVLVVLLVAAGVYAANIKVVNPGLYRVAFDNGRNVMLKNITYAENTGALSITADAVDGKGFTMQEIQEIKKSAENIRGPAPQQTVTKVYVGTAQ